MPTINFENEKTFVEFTRVYKMSGSEKVSLSPITLSVDDIASVRPSNRLGKASHRSTITLSNGDTVELADLYSAVTDAIAA